MISGAVEGGVNRSMSVDIKRLTWLTDIHLEFCSHQTRNALYQSINQAGGEIVVITGDLSAGLHRLAQYSELAEHVRKPIYFVLGNHDRYGRRLQTQKPSWNASSNLFRTWCGSTDLR
jgi:predicted MPP superfamily phosphohydrolase